MKQPSFVCFVEGCGEVFWNADDRRVHCINAHSFSESYPFDCLLGRALSDAFIGDLSAARSGKMEQVTETTNGTRASEADQMDVDMDVIDDQFKRLAIPKNISFGRGRGSSVRGVMSRMHYHKQQTDHEPKVKQVRELKETVAVERVPLKIVKTYKAVQMDE